MLVHSSLLPEFNSVSSVTAALITINITIYCILCKLVLFSNTANPVSFPIQSVLHQIEAVVKHPNKNTTTTKPQACCGTPVELEGPGAKQTPPFWKTIIWMGKNILTTVAMHHTQTSHLYIHKHTI